MCSSDLLENSVETADSMKSRGYGLRGRNNFSIYRFDTRDKMMVSLMAVMGLIVMLGILTKTVHFLYYPMVLMNKNGFLAIVVYLCYGVLCMLPLMMNVVEDVKWHYLKSKI